MNCDNDIILKFIDCGRWNEYIGFVAAYNTANLSSIGEVGPPLNRRVNIRIMGSVVDRQLIVNRPIFAARGPDLSCLLKFRMEP
jgi:hypothetical protein